MLPFSAAAAVGDARCYVLIVVVEKAFRCTECHRIRVFLICSDRPWLEQTFLPTSAKEEVSGKHLARSTFVLDCRIPLGGASVAVRKQPGRTNLSLLLRTEINIYWVSEVDVFPSI